MGGVSTVDVARIRGRDGSETCHPEPEDTILEQTDLSAMCVSVMTVILKSLGVASANGEVAELFSRIRFGGVVSTWVSSAGSS